MTVPCCRGRHRRGPVQRNGGDERSHLDPPAALALVLLLAVCPAGGGEADNDVVAALAV